MSLLEAALKGDKSALGGLLESVRSYMLRVARRNLPANLQAKESGSDLVQKTFADAYNELENFKGDTLEQFRAWLERMLLNNLADMARRFRAGKRQVKREVSLADSWAKFYELVDPSTPSQKAIKEEEKARAMKALEALPEKYRRVLELRTIEKRKFDDIAKEMEQTTDAVKKLWARAVLRLKKELEAE